MRVVMVLILSLAAFASSALPAAAEPIGDAGITRDEMAAMLKANGYPVTAKLDSKGRSILTSTAAGVSFDVYFFDCDSTERCQAIQLAAGWSGSFSLEKVNEWNQNMRHMRAYLDTSQDGAPLFGEVDLSVAPGGSTEQIADYLKTWETTILAEFKAHFGL